MEPKGSAALEPYVIGKVVNSGELGERAVLRHIDCLGGRIVDEGLQGRLHVEMLIMFQSAESRRPLRGLRSGPIVCLRAHRVRSPSAILAPCAPQPIARSLIPRSSATMPARCSTLFPRGRTQFAVRCIPQHLQGVNAQSRRRQQTDSRRRGLSPSVWLLQIGESRHRHRR